VSPLQTHFPQFCPPYAVATCADFLVWGVVRASRTRKSDRMNYSSYIFVVICAQLNAPIFSSEMLSNLAEPSEVWKSRLRKSDGMCMFLFFPISSDEVFACQPEDAHQKNEKWWKIFIMLALSNMGAWNQASRDWKTPPSRKQCVLVHCLAGKCKSQAIPTSVRKWSFWAFCGCNSTTF